MRNIVDFIYNDKRVKVFFFFSIWSKLKICVFFIYEMLYWKFQIKYVGNEMKIIVI